MRLTKFLAAVFTGLLVTCSAAAADTYPSRTVSLVVPYPPGGSSDVIARVINEPLSRLLGQPVIVDNIGGAAGAIGAQKMLNAKPDGYSVFQGSVTETILVPLANAAVKFKSDEFRPVQMIGVAPMVLVARADLQANDMDELIALARRQAAAGAPLTYGSTGFGSLFHVLGEKLSVSAGAPMVHVPYKGGAPLMQDLASGQVDFMLAPIQQQILGMTDAGRMKILGTLEPRGTKGAPLLKKYPSVNDGALVKDFSYQFWHGYFVRKDTPEAIVERLNKALGTVLQDPKVRAQLEEQGLTVAAPGTTAEAARAYEAEIARYRDIAKVVKLQPQ
ncbi:tripartite tricarboxylate transporter substrate binding protein [Variovorax sp. Sphag1AA]|uniref:Bug family tripartite tricarboxylate transporter substrate binding protein n=1 Tax=Variovorax sp. Sphag1AA TaxID=2587027 RepID=UPI001622A511|nr:tripartite tricarboxylate transporter substrate binding protein [Variovorax sp. Sphag1AA]MBB3181272.1 tripartite-type tricarboxylate transporter receptor subunit TctC [Variovorax sp. Sphag1AA]